MFKSVMPRILNREAQKGDPAIVFHLLGNLEGKTIGDIGSGGGFYSMKFADRVGKKGRVFAIDTNKKFLSHVRKLAQEGGQKNITTIHSQADQIPLEAESVDLFFCRNTYHHIPEPEGYFLKLLPLLKPDGSVVIIDYKKTSKLNFVNLFGHHSAEKEIQRALCQAGYRHVACHRSYENQSFNIFKKTA